MTLNVTIGGAYAESFCTVQEATTIIAASGLNSSNLAHWNALSSTAKELRLRLAANFIGTLPLRGKRVYKYQALAFPRDIQLDYQSIPTAIKEAQVLFAYLLIDPNIEATDPSQGPERNVVLSSSVVKSVEVLGIMKVGTQHTLDGSTLRAQATLDSYLFKAMKAYGGFIWILMKPFLAQVRGGNIDKLHHKISVLLDSPDFIDIPDTLE